MKSLKKNGFLSRLDIIAESNLLHLTKDQDEKSEKDDATGGTILYLSPGLRATFGKHVSIGCFSQSANMGRPEQRIRTARC